MWKLYVCLTGGLLLVASPLWSQPLGIMKGEKVTLAPVIAPEIFQVRATEEKGEVHIWISRRSTRLADKKGGGPGGRELPVCLGGGRETVHPWQRCARLQPGRQAVRQGGGGEGVGQDGDGALLLYWGK